MNDKIMDFPEKSIGRHLLTPTKIYVKAILNEHKLGNIKACAHITGGGLIDNLPRVIPNNLNAKIYGNNIKPNNVFNWIKNLGNITSKEMLKTFNCGVGMCVIVDSAKADEVLENFIRQGEEAAIIGKIEAKSNSKRVLIVDENKIWN